MIERSRFQNVFGTARKIGEWEERAVTPSFADPQIHVSRSTGAQPFFLICEKDTVLVQASGSAHVELRLSGMRHTAMAVGDVLYIPGGTACRVEPLEEAVTLRYKAMAPGLEAVAWFCPSCDGEVWRHEFDAEARPVQAGYLEGCEAFNADPARRTCGTCETALPAVELTPYRWAETVVELDEEAAADPIVEALPQHA